MTHVQATGPDHGLGQLGHLIAFMKAESFTSPIYFLCWKMDVINE